MANRSSYPPQPQDASYPWSLLKPSLVFGSCSGALGLTIGSIGGVLRSAHPMLFAIISGGQWFVLGTTYWLSRSSILEVWASTSKGNQQREASALAGAFSGGTVAALLRGRRNVLPATLMFGIFGYLGQAGYEQLDAAHAERVTSEVDNSQGLMERIATRVGRSKWSPLKLLDDKEYAQMMRDKLVRIDADIAVVDEDIRDLQKQKNGETPKKDEKR